MLTLLLSSSRWLSAVTLAFLIFHGRATPPQWQPGSGYRFYPVEPKGSGAGFTRLLPAETGVVFTNRLSLQAVAENRVTENGSGVALGDVDGDGLCDIFFAALQGNSILYKNLGDWKFQDVTAASGLSLQGQMTTGVNFVDLDGDSDLDLLANSLGTGTRAFLNNGKGQFTEMQNKLVRRFSATSMSLADIDRDNDLDLYVTTYRTITSKDELPPLKIEARQQNGKIVITPEGRFAALAPEGNNQVQISELGERDFLYANLGKGQFGSISWTNGAFLAENGQRLSATPLDWGLSVLLRDLNDDGWPDIYVCNDFFYSADRLFLNQGNNTFIAASVGSISKISLASMAVDVADINRDGYDDIFVAEMLSREHPFRQTHRENMDKAAMNNYFKGADYRPEVPRNTLFLNRGDGTYAEIAEFAGVDASEWSWGAIFMDVDLDGYEDLIIPTGNNTDVQHADGLAANSREGGPDSIERRVHHLKRLGPLRSPIVAFRNNGDLTFKDMGMDWGFKFSGIINGAACADLDNDGDLDLVGNSLNGAAVLYRNEAAGARVGIRLRGIGENTHAVGAKVTIHGGPVVQSQTFICGGRYLSNDDSMRVFAAGTNEMTAVIRWPEGSESTHSGLRPNHIYEITRPASTKPVEKPPQNQYFQEIALNHLHQDEPFDDFFRQPLLPAKVSNYGPGVTCADLNGDGSDEVIVAGGKGGSMAVFRNQGGKLQIDTNSFSGSRLESDQTSILPFSDESSMNLLVAHSNYDTGATRPPAVTRWSTNGQPATILPGTSHSSGPMAMADIDRDGDLDLFVGSRVLPGKYPRSGPSKILLNNGARFEEMKNPPAIFGSLGMVTATAFADLDGNNFPDLVVASELGSIKVLSNNEGQWTDSTESLGLSAHVGIWNSIAISDFNNDGRLDLIAGNLGQNHKYRRYIHKPIRIYHGDLTLDGTFDILEAFYNPILQKYCPWQDLDSLVKAAPELKQQVQSFGQFSVAGFDELFPTAKDQLAFVELNSTSSALFLNKGSSFEHRPLPAEAQLAPVYGIALADFDGDGNEDAFLAQNNSDYRWDQGPIDAGAGVILVGDGNGNFKAEKTLHTGIAILGDARGAATLDVDLDGRADLVVGQNNGPVKFYRNGSGRAGITVQLKGPPQNPLAIGAEVQLFQGTKGGRKRVISCGSGYSSQSSVQQTWRLEAGHRLVVTWPDGKKSEATVEQLTARRVISHPGAN